MWVEGGRNFICNDTEEAIWPVYSMPSQQNNPAIHITPFALHIPHSQQL